MVNLGHNRIYETEKSLDYFFNENKFYKNLPLLLRIIIQLITIIPRIILLILSALLLTGKFKEKCVNFFNIYDRTEIYCD